MTDSNAPAADPPVTTPPKAAPHGPVTPEPEPRVQPRPLLDRYLFEQQISRSRAAVELGLSREAVRLYCLAFGNPARIPPSKDSRARIEAWSNGAVPGWSFDDTPAARAAFFTPPGARGSRP